MTILDREAREHVKAELDRTARERAFWAGVRHQRRHADAALRPPADITQHPSFRRVLRATNPVWSGLSREELEQQIAGILAVVDAADNRRKGLV